MQYSLDNYLVIFSLIFCIFSCSPSQEEQVGLTEITISESHILPFDEAVSAISFVPLKNREELPVNLNCSVWDLKITSKYIIYSTLCNPEAKIHLFDLKGNHINTFEKIGGGPEEYQNIQGVFYEEDTLHLSTGNGEIKQYLFPSFDYAGTVSLGKSMFIPNFAKISGSKWLFSAMFDGDLDENKMFNLFNSVDITTLENKELSLKATQLSNEISEGEMDKIGNNFILNYAFADTLYTYDGEVVNPYIRLDFGERSPTSEDLKMDSESFEATITNQGMIINMGKIWQTDSITHLKTFALAKNPDLDLSNIRTFPIHEVFINHRSNQVVAFPSLVGWSNGKGDAKDGWFYEVLQTDDWVNALDNGLFGSYTSQLEEMLDGLGDFEDPILIKYQINSGN
ncbi:6-bladed beta-propeller [Algoriphagus machipongonensis]|uniref:6-bladed beta-propeller protein n=1 Tax=Algoriphagus machipongonensis TaxID=388413 RepID=A3I0P7_9BACT|nr:6-bladed beta-propeller [Algoriphagus machipongonensis]EAZ80043.1 hypothetical protein ALPR1_15479 [Algoriphagus machipongonensis]